jgi:peptide/nickel transport system substrate-binding protein
MKKSLLAILALFVGMSLTTDVSAQNRRITVGTALNYLLNPYQESTALNYSIGCQTYGCLATYDYNKGDYIPMLAKSWKALDPSTWVIELRTDVKWENGEPVTAADVIHSYNRIMKSTQSNQKANFENIATMEAPDPYTIRITTKKPDVTLLDNIAGRLIITNKKAYEQYSDKADSEHRLAFGPYRVVEVSTGQFVAIRKVPTSAFAKPEAPDEVVFRNMKEPEQRLTALLRGEVQIVQYMPPHMIPAIEKSGNNHVALVNGIENNFLVMNPRHKPWDNKLLRQAVAFAIDRDTIIQVVLNGLADRLDGPIGPGQYAYTPDLKPRYTFDPAKAKELLKKAGYPNGLTVEMQSSVNWYINDRQTNEAIAAMLGDVGIKVDLKTPERTSMNAQIEQGKVPFYYYGRGSILDPGQFLSQYFETGTSNRAQYSNPEVDKILSKARGETDPAARKKLLQDAMSIITDEAPAAFLWRMKQIYGVANSISFSPAGGSGIFANDITFK